jgi:hypothetical protein
VIVEVRMCSDLYCMGVIPHFGLPECSISIPGILYLSLVKNTSRELTYNLFIALLSPGTAEQLLLPRSDG